MKKFILNIIKTTVYLGTSILLAWFLYDYVKDFKKPELFVLCLIASFLWIGLKVTNNKDPV